MTSGGRWTGPAGRALVAGGGRALGRVRQCARRCWLALRLALVALGRYLRSLVVPAEGWISLLFFVLTCCSVVWSIQSALWTDGLDVLTPVLLMAMAVGYCLARSPAGAAFSTALGSATGLTWTVYLLGRGMDPALRWGERLLVMGSRLSAWLQEVWDGGIGTDNLPFIVVVAWLVWALGFHGAWATFRSRQPWLAVVACGAVILVNLGYATVNLLGFFVLFLFSSSLLLIRMHMYVRERSWRSQGIDYNPEVLWGVLQSGSIFTALVIGAALLAPTGGANDAFTAAWDWAGQPWQQMQDGWNRVFGALNPPVNAVAVFGSALPFRGAMHLTQEVVLRVQSPEGRYYMGEAFDRYTPHGWQATAAREVHVGGDDEAALRNADRRRGELKQKVRVVKSHGTLVLGAALPIEVQGMPMDVRASGLAVARLDARDASHDEDLPPTVRPLAAALREALASEPGGGQVPGLATRDPGLGGRLASVLPAGQWSVNVVPAPDGSVAALELVSNSIDTGNVFSFHVRTMLKRQAQYTVVSAVSTASEGNLRKSGNAYPEWVRGQYLPLPPMPARVAALAHQLTDDQSNAYDRAAAVEHYLRGFRYVTEIPNPPPDRDAIDWFLFDQKEAYCDYYAAAMAVLLRQVGIPARVIAGYGPGRYDGDTDEWVVREADSHTWPQVYFPEYGWIDFEPSSNRPMIKRGPEEETSPTDVASRSTLDNPERDLIGPEMLDEGEGGGSSSYTPSRSRWLWLPPTILGMLALLAVGGAALTQMVWRVQVAGLQPPSRAFGLTSRLAGLLGCRPQLGETPAEYTARMAECFPASRTTLLDLGEAHQAAMFSRRRPLDDRQAERLWRRLRVAMLQEKARAWRARLRSAE